jgi:hypothetical protein
MALSSGSPSFSHKKKARRAAGLPVPDRGTLSA